MDSELEKLKIENENLKKMNEDKSDLISISAHQLRTSLSALKWTFKMILNKDLGEINEDQKSHLEKALISNERAISLINDLLTLNQTNDTSIAFHYKKIDIEKLLEQVISEFQGEMKNKQISLDFTKSDSPYEINGDEDMIRVVLQNLVENAIKYSNVGKNISINLSLSNNNILLSVHDGGIGINKEDQMKIFNKFFRAPNAIEKESVGSGLGLFTTKNIVERHNGKIWFESTKDEGTTFFVTLPTNEVM